jgi:hypothetical protein
MDAFKLILVSLAGWMNCQQQHVIEDLQEEVRILKEQQGSGRPKFTDEQGRALLKYSWRPIIPSPCPSSSAAGAAPRSPRSGTSCTAQPYSPRCRHRSCAPGEIRLSASLLCISYIASCRSVRKFDYTGIV